MHVMYMINSIIGVLFLLCYSYQLYYILVAFIKKKRPHSGEFKYHKFAVLISARNEEEVLAGLINSINNQDYPSELITTFVVADNCTDRTAQVAREAGAIVFERFDSAHVGKGYALEFLFDALNAAWYDAGFDAFFVFDADNILMPNYISEMNKTYCDGYKALTSYRNSKNYGDNWLSAGYALWFLREAKYLNNSRMILGSSCAISGTGFMVDKSLFQDENGKLVWKHFLLTEDIEFTASSIVDGLRIGYCADAMLYDEQPVTFKQSWHQRLRWAKGYLQVYANYGRDLFRGLFGKKKRGEEGKRARHSSFSCYDMFMTIMPAMILCGFIFVADIIGAFIMLFGFGDVANFLSLMALPTINASILMFVIGWITTITEWKNIHTRWYKKIFYAFTFPVFMLTYIPIALVAIFSKKVEWKPIKHSRAVNLDDIHKAAISKSKLNDEEQAPEKVEK